MTGCRTRQKKKCSCCAERQVVFVNLETVFFSVYYHFQVTWEMCFLFSLCRDA